ncbi:hypothetical protein GOP47_0027568 [Adiantum capillus-veneris]|nr:hypothetical protein GOP47_0027568 [Adiantum capillus-veneris]
MLNVLQHENLVKLLGYCAEEDHRILVFEFMPLGSLEDQLHARPEPMDWSTRMKIAVGFEPKLSNFGWAKLGPIGNKTHVSTKVFGTNGYIAPEYATTGQLSIKSDVYSFGVILLELITGRKAIDPSRGAEESNLVIWAHPFMLDEGLFAQLADPMLHGQFPAIGLSQAVALAKMCLEENVASRPPIAEIIPSLDALPSRSL